jgi:hypothetical protein
MRFDPWKSVSKPRLFGRILLFASNTASNNASGYDGAYAGVYASTRLHQELAKI